MITNWQSFDYFIMQSETNKNKVIALLNTTNNSFEEILEYLGLSQCDFTDNDFQFLTDYASQ